jgi:subtilisin family serine protease
MAMAVLACLLLARPSITSANDTDNAAGSPDVVGDEIVVTFDDGVSLTEQRRVVRRSGGEVEEKVESLDGLVVTPRGSRSTDDVIDELWEEPAVEFVEPNFVVRSSRVPNDAAFSRLWGLSNSGQLGGKPGADISATLAWDVATGGDIPVAIVDTGVDYNHADLRNNMWRNPREPVNGVDDDQNGFVDDVYGADFANDDGDPNDDSSHGTHVAGIIGAEGNNAAGVAGVNWRARMIGLKFLDQNGEGNTADAAEAIDYAVQVGARVVNASWGGPAFSYTLFKAIRNAGNRGVVVVAAAGNSGDNTDSSPEYPASYDLPNIISVAATDVGDTLVDFSNFGARTVDLAAPGDEIYSTVPRFVSTSTFAYFSGTSMAAPYVAGAADLFLSRNPAASVQQVRDTILQTVDPLPTLAGKTVTGGRLNIAKLVGATRPAETPVAHPSRDLTAPSPFRLIRPRNRYASSRRGVRFRWQRSHDSGGIKYYRLYVDGKRRKLVKDPDGKPGGRDPKALTRYRLRGGRHRWFVRAFDYAGNSRRSKRSVRGSRSARVLFVERKRTKKPARAPRAFINRPR